MKLLSALIVGIFLMTGLAFGGNTNANAKKSTVIAKTDKKMHGKKMKMKKMKKKEVKKKPEKTTEEENHEEM